ncbi:LysR substrate binding domain protein [compost metagenome]
MVEAGVGIGIIPESAALRHSRTMELEIVELDEPWAIRERSILVRELDALPGAVRALIATLMPVVAEAGGLTPPEPS